jgi:hypothetical protein
VCAVVLKIEIYGHWEKEISCGILEGTTKEHSPSTSADLFNGTGWILKGKVPAFAAKGNSSKGS